MESKELYHYGRKGQKWGQRLYQNKDGSLTPLGRMRYKRETDRLTAERKTLINKKRTNAKIDRLNKLQEDVDNRKKALDDYEKAKGNSKEFNTQKSSDPEKPKKISEMSDAELRDRINRINLENSYKSLVEGSSKKEVSKGRQFVEDVLTNSGKNIATQTVTFLMGTGVNMALEKALGIENAINPRKGQKDK